MNRLSLIVVAVLLAPVFSGCALAFPFNSDLVDPETERFPADVTESGRVLVGLTHAVVRPEHREAFDEQVDRVFADLDERQGNGLLGYTARAELFGDKVWTQSVWASEDHMVAFMLGDVHFDGMEREAADGWFESASFAHLEVDATDAPLDWERVFEELDRSTNAY